MSVPQRVPDEVWDALPPRRLPRGRALAALALLSLLALATAWLLQAGIASPNLAASSDGGSWQEGTRGFTTRITLDNHGRVPTTVASVAVSGAALRIDSVTLADSGPVRTAPDALPLTLDPSEGATVEVAFTVADCAALSADGFRLTVEATSPRGTATVDITPDGREDPGLGRPDGVSFGTPPTAWPGSYAAGACAVPLPR